MTPPATPDYPVINPCDYSDYPPDINELFEFWHDYGSDHVYVWADDFTAAEDTYIDWLDEEGHCGAFTWITLDDIKNEAKSNNIPWKSYWPDWDDRDFEKLMEIVEMDMRRAGSPSSCENTNEGTPYMDHTWDSLNVKAKDVIDVVARASAFACHGHDFMHGDKVWYDGYGHDSGGGVFEVEGVQAGEVDIRRIDGDEEIAVDVPVRHHVEHYREGDPKHMVPKSPGDLTEDFFFPPLPKMPKGRLFMADGNILHRALGKRRR